MVVMNLDIICKLVATILLLHATLSAQITKPKKIRSSTTDDALVKQLLAEDLGIRSFLFSQVVKSSTGHDVNAFDQDNLSHKVILVAIQQAVKETITQLNKADSPIKKLPRINEASRYFEDLLLTKLDAHPDLSCNIPKNTKGREQRSGYPDMRIEHTVTKTVFYLDPKLFENKSRASSLRTFYFEPKNRTMKIHDDAVHLLLGISHDGVDGEWTFKRWELVDLSKLKVRLKAEFQASNKDLYRKGNIISSGK